jgi:hypothetical protein
MPAASASQGRSSSLLGAPRSKTGRERAVRTESVGAAAGVRWDRLGRVAMLLIGGALVYLYLSAGIRMLSTWRQARSDGATVATMEHENRRLVRQHEVLGRQGTLEVEARQLGMMKKGERSYIVSGLPNN